MAKDWSAKDRAAALAKAERDGIDVLVIGGGITGAGVLRDAAVRGMNVLLVERGDFASGTSSSSSKLVHGGLRYIAQKQFGVVRESCQERDLLLKNNPNLIRPLPMMLPAHEGSKAPLWQLRAAMWIYSALANFRASTRFKILKPKEALKHCPDLKADKLKGAALYHDGQADDARLVLETIKSARDKGGEAVNYTEAVSFEHDEKGKISAVTIRDMLDGKVYTLHPTVVINAAGPAVERIRNMDQPVASPEVVAAKGVHIVIPSGRIKSDVCVNYETDDGRYIFMIPWGDVTIIGTTDTFSKEIDDPVVHAKDVDYILSATNKAFPSAHLTTNDICSVFAGVRPLVAEKGEQNKKPDEISREHRIWEDASGLISVAGGKLTTFRTMGQEVMKKALSRFPKKFRKKLKPVNTKDMPLRQDNFKAPELEKSLCEKFNLAAKSARHLVKNYGADALEIMNAAQPDERQSIGNSYFTYAEIPWVMQHEAATNLTDILERRMRMAILAQDRGVPEIKKIAEVAGRAAGWDEARIKKEEEGYLARIKKRYTIQPD
ncbi:MAG: glycerol-3-phosphate dehydrogenase/oxidase [Alphaproteobacteria bacterium]|nr:MAG: glycerol-3-phosphate dehydrogenase/oxidase [Alphaproteobacteria bacterium]